MLVWRHFCWPRIIIDSLLSTVSSDRMYMYVCTYIRVRACERPVYVLYVALYTNRKSEAITRYGTDKAGLALPRISLARLFKAYTYNIARRAVRPPIQRTYPRLELFLQ